MNRPTTPTATLLIIDPHPITMLGIAAVLDSQGYECHCASDAEAARKAVESLPLDVIICDTAIAADGVAFCNELKSRGNIQDVPVIFLGDRDNETQSQSSVCGTFWINNPFDPDMLIDVVAKALWMPHLISTRLRQHPAPNNASIVPAPAATRRAVTPESQRR